MAIVRYTSRPCLLAACLFPAAFDSHAEDRLPVIKYDSGDICWEVTDYVLAKFRQHLKQSTLETYVANLIPWIDFAELNGIAFEGVTDLALIEYSVYLKRLDKGENNQINKLIRAVVKLLIWLQENGYFSKKVIAIDGSAAVTYSNKKNMDKRGSYHSSIYHMSFLEKSNEKKRYPIASATIEALVFNVSAIASRRSLQRRMECIIDFLRASSARREEVSKMTVQDVIDARNSILQGKSNPRIRVFSSKRKIAQYREIPIDISVLQRIERYVAVDRRKIIADNIAAGNIKRDCGALWVNCWGRQLSKRTITDYIRMIRVKGGIAQEATPHMFRHLGLTRVVVEAIEVLKELGVPLSQIKETVLMKLCSYSGHSHPESAEPYLHLALAEVLGLKDLDRALLERLQRDETRSFFIRILNKLDKLADESPELAEIKSDVEIFRSLVLP